MSVRGTVLVVDDDADVRESLCDVLEIEGYHAVQAGSALEAIAWIEAHEPPDVVLLDVAMPGMSGLEMLDRMRAEGRAIGRVLVLSAFDDLDVGPDARQLRKPVDLHVLLQNIAELCPAPAPSRA